MHRWLVPIRNLFFSSPEKAAQRIYDDAPNPSFDGDNGAFILKGEVEPLPSNASERAVQDELLAWCKTVTGI